MKLNLIKAIELAEKLICSYCPEAPACKNCPWTIQAALKKVQEAMN